MAQRAADAFISNNDRAFILTALKDECRLDGRKLYDFRKARYMFATDDSSATLQLGQTRVMTVVTATLEAPFPDRPNEGPVRFNVEFSPMASPAFEAGRPGEVAVGLARLVERGLRGSGAVDQEALCVMAGRKVWSLRVDIHVLDHDGNLPDACCLCALAALLAYRKPEVSVGGSGGAEVVVHSPEVREPLPLTLHHLPVAVSFALFEGGNTVVMDPTLREEAAMSGRLTVIMNHPAKELCAVHKAEGIGLSTPQFMRCLRLAASQVESMVGGLKRALEVHEVERVQARVRRHQVASMPSAALPSVQLKTEATDMDTDASELLPPPESSDKEDSSEEEVESEEHTEAAMHLGLKDRPEQHRKGGGEARRVQSGGDKAAESLGDEETGDGGNSGSEPRKVAQLRGKLGVRAARSGDEGPRKGRAGRRAGNTKGEAGFDDLADIAQIIAGASAKQASGEVQDADFQLAAAVKRTKHVGKVDKS